MEKKTKVASIINKLAVSVVAVSLIATTSLEFRRNGNPFWSQVGQTVAYGKPIIPSSDDARLMLLMHQAGLRGDQSQIPAMIKALQSPAHPFVTKTALLALARLGAAEAIPVVTAMRQSEYVRVVKARLLAEAGTRGLGSSRQQSASKIDRFYRELRMSPSDVNSGVARHHEQNSGQGNQQDHSGAVASYAVDQLADMVYHGSYADYAALPGVAQVNFHLDPPSELKVRLAPLPRQQRILTMTQELAHKKTLTFYEFDEMQLLADEGPDASLAIAAQLRVMEAHRSGYSQEGWDSLFRVLGCIADKSQAPLVEHFKHDADPVVAQLAFENYGVIVQGIQSQIVAGY